MESKDLESKFKEIGKKVAEVSKSAFDKASDKVQDFTDKSILKIDIKKLQTKKDELYKNFGEKVSNLLFDGTLKELVIENQEILNNIEEKHQKLFEKIKNYSALPLF